MNNNIYTLDNYINALEKTTSYLIALLMAVLTTFIYCHRGDSGILIKIVKCLDYNEWEELLKKYYHIFIAILATLPYFYYYILVEIKYRGHRNKKYNNLGLFKCFILYELVLLAIYYLLLVVYSSVEMLKNAVALVVICFLILYFYVRHRKNFQGKNILTVFRLKQYNRFDIIIIATIIPFVYLIVKNNGFNNLIRLFADFETALNEAREMVFPFFVCGLFLD